MHSIDAAYCACTIGRIYAMHAMRPKNTETRSSAITEGPRDALCSWYGSYEGFIQQNRPSRSFNSAIQ